MSHQQRLVNYEFNRLFPQALKAEGVYIYDVDGKRYLDGCGGALVVNLGHRVPEISRAMAAQAETLAYVYRFHFSCPAGEELAVRFCELTEKPMGRAFFTNSGSEATEMAIKLSRAFHLAVGENSRYKIISRWQSYHGITMGALSWSGFTARRADYQPYLLDSIHIPPAYCYRCWFGRRPETCRFECAHALENTILNEGPETVAAFIAEPIVGSALAAASPPPEYFQIVRDICNRHGALVIAEEVMTGAGRTGGRFFASDHFPGSPDVIVFGKGVGGGYYPLAGVLISSTMADRIAVGAGGFAPGQSHSGHPIGMAAGLAFLDYFEKHDLLARAEEMGEYMGRRLRDLLTHPLVGDVRGMGLMWGLEFVQEKDTKKTFDPALKVHLKIYEAAKQKGLIVLPSGGCDRGHAGDMALLGPPLIISREQIDELVGILGESITQIENSL
jgi:adenosylmethionine-8-amino-7-oxononanoate aminotransferase